jgi:DNA polymerase
MKSLDKAAVSSALSRKNLPDEARDLLRLRQSAAKTSTAKYKKVLVATGEGSRLRGTLQFYGAMRTGRLAGRLFQPQNLPSRGLLNADICVPAIKKGMADLLYDDILLAASSAVRGLICAPEGRKIVFGDLAGIEARVLPWLASEEHVLEVFRSGRDIYIETAARILNKPPGEVTKFERTAYGKVPVLALGYQGGPNAFISMAANYGLDELDPAFVTGIVRGFRNRHPAIVRFWHALQNAAWDAITEPGTTHEAGRISEITVREHEGRQWLTLRLPSGRLLCYPEPDIEERTQITEKEVVVGIDQETGLQQTKKVRTRVQRAQIHFSGIDQYTRKWTRVPTYSGKLAENVTQAVAADIMLHGMESAEAQGYHVLLTVHDELVTETPDTEAYSGDELAEIMATPPEWAEGLPLAAEGDEAERYKK